MNLGNSQGNSFVEVIVAMIIMALLVTGLNACVLTLINSNLASKELSSATSAGQQFLEELRRAEYSSIVTSSDIVRDKYLRSWTVTSDSTQKKVDLNIFWPATNSKKVIELSTIIARP